MIGRWIGRQGGAVRPGESASGFDPQSFAPQPFAPAVNVEAAFRDAIAGAALRVLEVGTLQARPGHSTHHAEWFGHPAGADPGPDYVRLDIEAGPDVDVVGDLHALPDDWTASFDAFLAVAVFEHLARPWIAAREVARVLKPGGLFFISTHQTYPVHGFPSDYFRFSDAALRLILEDAGLTVTACHYDKRCLIVPPPDVMPTDHAPYWNKDFPSYLLVNAMGRR